MQNFLVGCLKFAKVLRNIDPVVLEEELEDEELLSRLKGANEAAFQEALKEELAASLVPWSRCRCRDIGCSPIPTPRLRLTFLCVEAEIHVIFVRSFVPFIPCTHVTWCVCFKQTTSNTPGTDRGRVGAAGVQTNGGMTWQEAPFPSWNPNSFEYPVDIINANGAPVHRAQSVQDDVPSTVEIGLANTLTAKHPFRIPGPAPEQNTGLRGRSERPVPRTAAKPTAFSHDVCIVIGSCHVTESRSNCLEGPLLVAVGGCTRRESRMALRKAGHKPTWVSAWMHQQQACTRVWYICS